MVTSDQTQSSLVHLLMILVVLVGSDAMAATPNAAQVLTELRARRDSVENLRVEATWEEFENGTPSKWEYQWIYRDDLGRMRIRCYAGAGALSTGRKRLLDDVYNGEITVGLIDDPTLNRLGKAFKAGEKVNSKNRYRAALIHNGEFPPRGGLSSRRNPLTCMDQAIIRDLSGLLSSQTTVTVEPVSGQQELYELRYHLDSKEDPHQLEHHVFVDAGKGWVVTRHEELFPNGKSARLKTCEYRRDEGGLWVPTKGQFRNLWGKLIPDLDWRFTVRRVVVNDPHFDESVFDVKLEPGVYVTDTRHQVSYTIGKDVVSNGDLNRLAKEALRLQTSHGKPQGLSPGAERRRGWGFGVSVGLLLVLITIFVWRRKERRSVSP